MIIINYILKKLNSFKEYQELFVFLRQKQELNTKGELGKLIRNGYYHTPDAEIYSGMIASSKPENIIEIGSGYSTIIARKTIEYLNLKTKITIVDPEPRTDVNHYADYKIFKPVEKTAVENYLLPKSIIFIDSSHILRAGGDLPFIFNNLIPSLPKDTLVHVHDIFLPYDYPNIYYKRYYNEQYLLYSLLTNTSRYKIEIPTHFLCRKYPAMVEEIIAVNTITKHAHFGCSIWFKIV